jgi:hypothetical protein
MCRDRSRAVCGGSISPSSALATRFHPCFHASWRPSARMSPADFHAHQAAPLLRPSGAAATVARASAALLAASTHGRSRPPPSPAYRAATPWPSLGRGSAPASLMAGANSRAATQSADTLGRAPVADPSRRRAYTVARGASRAPLPAAAGSN